MKITTHRCDFCGAKASPKEMATLNVPLTPEEIATRRRMGDDLRPARREFTPMDMFARYAGVVVPESSGVMSYDMCPSCVRMLLNSRFREIRRKLAGVDDE